MTRLQARRVVYWTLLIGLFPVTLAMMAVGWFLFDDAWEGPRDFYPQPKWPPYKYPKFMMEDQ
jgi:hypothetical protein